MSELATCPFCMFTKEEWEEGYPDTYSATWEFYAPFRTTILGNEAIECHNCGIVVIETCGSDPAIEWNRLSEKVVYDVVPDQND